MVLLKLPSAVMNGCPCDINHTRKKIIILGYISQKLTIFMEPYNANFKQFFSDLLTERFPLNIAETEWFGLLLYFQNGIGLRTLNFIAFLLEKYLRKKRIVKQQILLFASPKKVKSLYSCQKYNQIKSFYRCSCFGQKLTCRSINMLIRFQKFAFFVQNLTKE